MRKHAFRFIFLTTLCAAGAAFAQTPSSERTDSPRQAWLQVNLNSDMSTMNGGLQVLAQNIGDDAPSASAVGRHRDGIGANGAQASAPAIKEETGFDPVRNRSELIIFAFERAVIQTQIDLAYFYRNEAEFAGTAYHERGGWRAYRGNNLVGQGWFSPNSPEGVLRLEIVAYAPFDRLELFATPYVTESGVEIEPGLILTDSSDFLIEHIAYRAANEALAAAAR